MGLGRTLLSARTVWLSVQRDDGKCIFLKLTRNDFLLHRHPAMSLVVEARLILLEDVHVLLLAQGCPRLRWMFSEPDLLQIVYFSICDLEFLKKVHHFGSVNTSFAMSLFAWTSDASIFSNSSMSATKMSPFQIPPTYTTYPRNIRGKTFLPNWWSLGRWHSTNESTGISGPSNGSPNRRSLSGFLQTRVLERFADSSNTPKNPPTIFHPDLIAAILQKSLP